MDIFAKRLKELRLSSALTQKQLAEKIGTTADSIYSWEKGRSQPSIEMLRNLSSALSISSDYLIGITDIF